MSEALEAIVGRGNTDREAIALGDGIFMSRGTANVYRITSADGDVMINTGLPAEAERTRARLDAVARGPLRKIILTQGHPDHVGGWSQFNQAGIETIAQADHVVVREYWRRLNPFYATRITKLWGAFTGRTSVPTLPPEPVPTITFEDAYCFELGGRRIELYSVPGGETTDGLVVWLPQTRTVFIGNLMGPMFGHLPNLYTIRGDKPRSALTFIQSLDRVRDLEPEILINGHDAFRGVTQIRDTLTRVRDAITYARDATIAGMNEGKDLWTLMREIRLPADLELPGLHGKLSWIVRTTWEEYAGWFRYESTTELYDVPASEVWGDLVDLAGEKAMADRAATYLASGKPLQALHLTDIVISQRSGANRALEVRLGALKCLLENGGRANFSEQQWLKSEIAACKSALSGNT
jgi:glyoxylase-like metal-dependent hydrolase (beta-lactamase superfamily II)